RKYDPFVGRRPCVGFDLRNTKVFEYDADDDWQGSGFGRGGGGGDDDEGNSDEGPEEVLELNEDEEDDEKSSSEATSPTECTGTGLVKAAPAIQVDPPETKPVEESAMIT
ncbi:hypothetical protein BGW38_004173, partial [Lunasporangiospora selenospora]